MTIRSLLTALAAASAGSVLLASASLAQFLPPAPAPIYRPPANQARIWFYREFLPYENQATPYVRLNGVVVGVSQPGSTFYRDVPPGHYHISADSYLDAPEQDRDVDLAPGQEVFAKILSADWWNYGGGGGRRGTSAYRRDTFYIWLQPPEAARPAIAQSRFYGGGVPPAAPGFGTGR